MRASSNWESRIEIISHTRVRRTNHDEVYDKKRFNLVD